MDLNLKPWAKKNFAEFSRWEQREIYSYNDINEQNTNLQLVNKILQALDSSSDLDWSADNLDLLSEALIQKKLRNKNIDIKCWRLDNFPTSTNQLKLLCISSTKSRPQTIIRFWLDIYGNLINYKNTFLTITVIAGLIYFQFDLLGWALLLAWVVSNLVFLNLHEKCGHGYIQAKNKFSNTIVDLTSYLFLTKIPIIDKIDIEKIRNYHFAHHKYWQTSKDIIHCQLQNNNFWTFNFGDIKYVSDGQNHTPIINQKNNEKTFINRHQQIIVLILHLLLFFVLGIKYYFYFVVLQIWLANVYDRLFIEYIPHKLLKNKGDIAFLIPIIGTEGALHNEHHIKRRHSLDDSGLLRKYLNPHYYLVKLFFKIT